VCEHLIITTNIQQDLAADLLYKEIVNAVWSGWVDILKIFPTTIATIVNIKKKHGDYPCFFFA
jgi:hypothetical protein